MKQLTEGNKLIAEFMGFIPEKSSLGNTYTHPDKMGVYGGSGMKFQYHSSWDWIMPVVEKAEDIYLSNNPDSAPLEVLMKLPITSSIEFTWEKTVQFVQWYNQNNPK